MGWEDYGGGSVARRAYDPKKKKSSPARPYTPEQLGYASHSKIGAAHQPFIQDKMQANIDSGFDSAGRLLPPAPLPPGDPGPGSTSDGNGSGYNSAMAAAIKAEEMAKKQAAALQQLLGSRAFKAGSIDGELGRVGKAVSADQASAKSQYDQLAQYMGGLGNAYEGMQMTATPRVDPSLLRLIAANGGDTAGYGAQVDLANTMAAQGDVGASRWQQQMTAAANESKTSRLAETQMAANYANQELGAQQMGMEEALRLRQKDDQKALDAQKMQVVMQLIAAMSQGGDTVDVSQFFK